MPRAAPDSILLLGGGGFLGTAMTAALSARGRTVHVVGPGPRAPFRSSNVIPHHGRIEELDLLERILPCCRTVFHLASATRPADSAQHPTREGVLNILPSLGLLEHLQRYPEIDLVYLSSGGALYGEPLFDPVREHHPFSPRSYYGAGKAAIEAFISVFAKRSSRRVVVLRPTNLYGPGQPLETGFGVIRTMIEHLRRDTPMALWGDGNARRDFLYIDDMVRLCVQLAMNPVKTGIYNVGYGVSHSLREVIATAEAVTGKTLRVIHRDKRPIDVRTVSLDTSKVRRELGWQPEIDLEEGIRRTWQWITGT